ncbi:hypothetical protein [Methylocystis sp.]|uniref:hypothetical protein n=1 Tax=Methylocystis sp. TaxID=1911079 RepID=UPI003D0D9D57
MRLLPLPARRKFYGYVSALMRENAELARPCAELELLVERLRPPPTSVEIKARRDQMIIRAIANYDGAATVRAEALAKDLRIATGLKHAPSSERLNAVVEILRLNGGAPLAWRQIYEIWSRR